jgi:hypothetical protein
VGRGVVCVCVRVCVDVCVCVREREREGESQRERESQAASKLVSISVKRDLLWRQKRPSKEVSRGFIRGGPVTHNLSSLPGLVS